MVDDYREDTIVPLSRYILSTDYDSLPADAVDAAKRCIIDTLGVTIAGSTAPACDTVAGMVRTWGGQPECTVLAYGDRVPSPNAAWVNALMARARDFDCYHGPSSQHPGVTTVTAALVMGELVGGVSGKEAITAVVTGTDLSIRMRSAFKVKAGISYWCAGAYAVFPAAAIAGKLLGLDEERLIHAMGLALSQLSNTLQGHQDGALSVRVHHGLSVKAGLLSALMADKGITGPRNVLDGKFGLYPVYAQNQYDRDIILNGLGKRFLNTSISIKPWPCCGAAYNSISGTLQLVREHDIRPEDIEEIIVHIDQAAYNYNFEPEEEKKRPRTVPAAQFSIPYVVATAVVYRDLSLANFTDEAIKDSRVIEIAGKVRAVIEPEFTALISSQAPVLVEIKTTSGKVGPVRAEHPKGSPENPLTLDECVDKFRKCLEFSVKPLPRENTEEVIDLVKGLEAVKDISTIVRLLT
ncbi:MmgE/PrpD family protein [Chloroflexota bacterium]